MIGERPENFAVESGPMGPIGEGEALVIRVNRNCSWNRCLFCPVYKGRKYSPRTVGEIVEDIEAVLRTRELIASESSRDLTREVLLQVIAKNPRIYGLSPSHVSPQQAAALQTLYHVYRWMKHGAARVFLQDANAPAMPVKGFVQVLQHLRQTFPSVETITTYARSKTCHRKNREELRMLADAGLSWCFIGIESGCDEVLGYMKKGVTAREHAEAGEKLKESGIRMAAFVMPGLGGSAVPMRSRHIADTLSLLNEMRPEEVRVRSLAVLERAPLYDEWKLGRFSAADEDQLIDEIGQLTEGLSYNCIFETLQMTNPLFTVKGPLFQMREVLREGMGWYHSLTPLEKARLLFRGYVSEGYLSVVKAWGRYDRELEQLVTAAEASLASGSGDAAEKVSLAIFAIKSKGVP